MIKKKDALSILDCILYESGIIKSVDFSGQNKIEFLIETQKLQ